MSDFLNKITGIDEEAVKKAEAQKPLFVCRKCRTELTKFSVSGPVALFGISENLELLFCPNPDCDLAFLVTVGGIETEQKAS